MRRLAAISAVLVLLGSVSAAAAVRPQPSPEDPRIQVVRYAPGQVVELRGTVGFATSIAFAPGERVETIAIGDARAWQATATKRGDLMFLKPVQRRGATNMTVITSLRRYDFLLEAEPRSAASAVFGLRFDYPPPPFSAAVMLKALPPEPPTPKPPPQPAIANQRYTYTGSRDLLPTRVFDDGLFTYFEFAPDADYPAIYVLEPDGREAIMNFSVKDGRIVLDRVARGFVLRRGSLVAKIFNDGFAGPAAAASSLAPRSRKGWF